MGYPGWSTEEPSVVGDLTLLPRGATLQSDDEGVIADINRNVTTGGARYDTTFFEREIHEWHFRFPKDESPEFKAMYTAARSEDIYYVPDSDDMATVLQVRGEDPNFRPRNVSGKWYINGSMQFVYDWTFTISTAPGSVMIDD